MNCNEWSTQQNIDPEKELEDRGKAEQRTSLEMFIRKRSFQESQDGMNKTWQVTMTSLLLIITYQ